MKSKITIWSQDITPSSLIFQDYEIAVVTLDIMFKEAKENQDEASSIMCEWGTIRVLREATQGSASNCRINDSSPWQLCPLRLLVATAC